MGKTAIVTGASRGIGRSIAKRLARDGFSVVVNYAGNAKEAEEGGTFLVLSQAAQHVVDGGRIIALSSSVLAKSFPTYGPYIASKAGVEGLVHVLTNELRGRSISVNAVAPGPVGTELFLKDKTEAQIESFKKANPLERLGEPEDIANVVSFLAGPEGGWINGQVVRANGGFA